MARRAADRNAAGEISLEGARRAVRLAELIGALSLATDLGTGLPLEHGIRSCLLAVRLGEELGLSDDERTTVYYVALLRFIGCTSDASLWAEILGDEVVVGGYFGGIDRASPSAAMGLLFRHLGEGTSALHRVGMFAHSLPLMARYGNSSPAAHCEVGQRLADRLSLGPEVRDALGKVFERWDGKGLPRKLKGDDVPISVRVTLLVRDMEVFYRLSGADGATQVARERAGKAYDPSMADCLCRRADALFPVLDADSAWDAVLQAEPGARPELSSEQLDTALRAIADFIDLKSPYWGNHSPAVAEIAGEAARRCRLPEADATALRRAALVHDLGRVGVTSSIWNKPQGLNSAEWEQVRLYPYGTERALARSDSLSTFGRLAALNQERLDGSGYHRALPAGMLSPAARILAAADAYRAMTERRPHREPLSPQAAAAELEREVRSGRLDGDAVHAVLASAGHRVRSRREWPAGLSEREVEVLRLIAQGCSTRETAKTLVISGKTADRHIQNIYAKIGVSTRAAATLFALQHDLLADAPSVDGR